MAYIYCSSLQNSQLTLPTKFHGYPILYNLQELYTLAQPLPSVKNLTAPLTILLQSLPGIRFQAILERIKSNQTLRLSCVTTMLIYKHSRVAQYLVGIRLSVTANNIKAIYFIFTAPLDSTNTRKFSEDEKVHHLRQVESACKATRFVSRAPTTRLIPLF